MKTTEIAFALIAAILTAITTYKWKDIDWIGKAAFIFVILAAAFVAINSFRQTRKEALIEKVNAIVGDITDTKDATFPIVQIGYSGTQFNLLGGTFNVEPYGELFKLFIKDNRLHFWAVIRDFEGKPIAVIDNNEWTFYNKDYEYNDDKNGFEVVTKGDRKVIFQISYEGGIAKMAGLLMNKENKGIYFEPEVGGAAMNLIPHKDFNLDKTNNRPIFKYPREKHYGKRAN